jgi:predicted PurR-regulated permease PerM
MTASNAPAPPALPPAGDQSPRQRTSGWRSRDILRTATILAGIYLGLKLLWVAHSVFFLTFLGVLFGLVLSRAVDGLERRRIPRGLAAPLLVLAVLGAVAGLGTATAPQISGQWHELRDQLPAAIDRLEEWVEARQGGVVELLQDSTETAAGSDPAESRRTAADSTATDASPVLSIRESISRQVGNAGRHFFAFFSSAVAVFGAVLLVLIVATYIAIEPRLYHSGLMHLFPRRARKRAGEVLSATARMLRRWLVTQLIVMALVGAITAAALALLGVKAAIALGVIAGLLEFIPFVGPILAAVPAVAMAFLEGPETAVYVAIAYLGIQQLESNVITPLLMKEGMDLPPVLTIVTQATLSLVFGFVGLVVAVPLLAAAMVPVKMLYVRDVVGDRVPLPGEKTG